ncbi:hypothetical protein [Vannielia sp. SX4]|uniref:hypothetical protein n=1 Tax=Vannielia sp. SX4 TaxID=3463852 RepID=UPI0040580E80
MLDHSPQILRQFGISPDDTTPQFQAAAPVVQVIDRICGAGKTSAMISSLNPLRQYLIVTPLLEDVQEIIHRAEVPLVQPVARLELANPDDPNDISHTKRGHLRELLMAGESVVCTHALYSDLAYVAREGLLTGYDICIDEVPKTSDLLSSGSKTPSADRVNGIVWRNQYLRDGYAEIRENRQVHPTDKWRNDVLRGENTLSQTLYSHAEAGCLWACGETVLVWELPVALLTSGRSLTIMTYRFAGSLLQAFMDKHGIRYEAGRTPEHQAEEERLRTRARELITVTTIPGIDGMQFTVNELDPGRLTATHQRRMVNALKRLRVTDLKEAPAGSVLVTSLKSLWYRDGKSEADLPPGSKPQPGPICKQGRKTTGLFNLSRWSANVTRGTNAFRDCQTVIYLYNKNLNPGIAKTLGVPSQGEFNDLFAVSEMVQFVYRSAIRDGKQITLYVPSKRMRSLFQRWLCGDI